MIRTGIEEFDKLAKDAPAELQEFLDRVREQGWIVKATDKLPSRVIAYSLPRKGRFYYHPGRVSILDMWHEAKHLDLFEQRGNCKRGAGQRARDEIEACQFEYELGNQHGFSGAYMGSLERRIAEYREELEGP